MRSLTRRELIEGAIGATAAATLAGLSRGAQRAATPALDFASALTAAFAHDHREPKASRRIATREGPRSYWDILRWITSATLTGCLATVAPVGKTASGLPVGIQVMGP